MSERDIQRLTEAIDRLSLTTERLTAKVDLLISHGTAPESQPVPVPSADPSVGSSEHFCLRSQVVELHRTPFPKEFTNYCALWRFRGLEEGPGSPPDFCFKAASQKLSTKEPGLSDRVAHAHQAGFWAYIAVETNTVFTDKILLPGLRTHHWVVLRSSRSQPFRTTSLRDLEALCDTKDRFLILATFDSLTEVEIFCLAARTAIPTLLKA